MPPLPAVNTPIGRLWPVATDAGLVAISRSPDHAAEMGRLDLERSRAAARALRAWFDGALRDLDIELDLRGSAPFDREVYRAVRSIPFGETASYGEIALMAGHPGAARAVGNALARCELAPVVPCHRVIHADGRIGGWGSDLETKRWLLERERGADMARSPTSRSAARHASEWRVPSVTSSWRARPRARRHPRRQLRARSASRRPWPGRG